MLCAQAGLGSNSLEVQGGIWRLSQPKGARGSEGWPSLGSAGSRRGSTGSQFFLRPVQAQAGVALAFLPSPSLSGLQSPWTSGAQDLWACMGAWKVCTGPQRRLTPAFFYRRKKLLPASTRPPKPMPLTLAYRGRDFRDRNLCPERERTCPRSHSLGEAEHRLGCAPGAGTLRNRLLFSQRSLWLPQRPCRRSPSPQLA